MAKYLIIILKFSKVHVACVALVVIATQHEPRNVNVVLQGMRALLPKMAVNHVTTGSIPPTPVTYVRPAFHLEAVSAKFL